MHYQTNPQDPIPSSTPNLFNDDEAVRATTTKRFFNYVIDLALLYVLLYCGLQLLRPLSPETLYHLSGDNGFSLTYRLFVLLFYELYMSVVEAVFKGKSLRELITGTRAVNLDGSRIIVLTAVRRGFIWALPFGALSAFGDPPNPWQDKWTRTMVVEEKKSRLGEV